MRVRDPCIYTGMTYPTIDLNAVMGLLPIKEQLSSNPDYLDNPDCPYAVDVRDTLKILFPPAVVEKKRSTKTGGTGKNQITEDQAQLIEAEAMGLLKELQDLKAPVGKGMDHDTKISIIKAKTALIEKVIGVQERFYNIRKVSTFMKDIIGILESLDPDTRHLFQEKLEPYL